MSDTFKLTFYGTRGSRTVTGAPHNTWGGHTTCLGVQVGERQLVFDAGSGIVRLGEELTQAHFGASSDRPLLSYLFLTHTHYDHICGLPYFVPFYLPNSTTWLYGPRNPYMGFRQTIERFIHPPYHPIPLHEMQGVVHWGEVCEPESVFFVEGEEEPRVVNLKHTDSRDLAPPPERVETVIHTMHGYNHPKCGVTIYKIEHAGRSVIFATDVEGYVLGDQRLINFAEGANILIHDAMYTRERYAGNPGGPTQGWGHSTVEIATEVATKARVERLYLVHHDPGHTDTQLAEMEKTAASLYGPSVSARDGLTVDLLASFPASC